METMAPMEIEKRSMELITQELEVRALPSGRSLSPLELPIVKRVIHTTADFDYADNLIFSPGAVEKGLAALKEGVSIVTDTQMALAGINKTLLGKLGGQANCFMSDEDVALEAKERGLTRATVCMEKAARMGKPLIFAIGNAPTALIRLRELMDQGTLTPVLIIGVPVGFVNVVEAKELMIGSGGASIVARGRKGGSNVAAAIVNAMLYQLVTRE